jgi:A/G-specific adenine glycosylase
MSHCDLSVAVERPSASPALSAALLDWYDVHRRVLPWRARIGEKADPYRVWLSEIMLQQTRAATVADYYRAFIARWPAVEDLAAASLDDVLSAWGGLGYYARARNLHRCAAIVARDLEGAFPAAVGDLIKLPGIGAYTAGAIAAIAFDQPVAAVDGNAERVIARLFAIEVPLPAARRTLRALAHSMVPPERPGDFAQAMMDLGAVVCLPVSPRCTVCPWSGICRARREGLPESLPRRKPRAARPVRYGSAFLVERSDGSVLMRRRPQNGLLGGMMEVPSSPWSSAHATKLDAAPLRARWRRVGLVEHTFTHFHLVLTVFRMRIPARRSLRPPGGMRWVARADLEREALPSLVRKVLAASLSRSE